MSTISASTTTTTAYVVTADTTGALVLQTGATPTTALTIDTSQNVTLAGTLSTTGITNTGVATATRFNPTGSSVTGNGMYLPAANSLGLSTNGTNALYIDSSQNVGIGTSTPQTRLNLWSSSARGEVISNAYPTLMFDNTSTPAQFYITQPTADVYFSNQSSSGALIYNTNNTERMRIDSSGNLLLGTTTADTAHLVKIQSTTKAGVVFKGTQNVGNDGTLSIDIVNGTLLFVSENNAGDGALFFCGYASATITLISDPNNRYSTSITAGKICVTKSAASGTVTITNKLGSTKPITVGKVSTSD
jgi:hypothetical protein